MLNQKIRDRELSKYYLAVVHGRLSPPEGRLEHILLKDEQKKQVSICRRPVPGGRTAVTAYRTLAVRDNLSLIACDLITGRTHQIRAQCAAAGHPLLGDSKYGRSRDARERRFQALCAYRLVFRFTTDAGPLQYLNGRAFQIGEVDFVRTYFPGMQIPDADPLG